MRKYYLIGIGGFFGAVLRYIIREIPNQSFHGSIPVDTMAINIAGAFLLAFIFRAAMEYWYMDLDYRSGICTGFLGAFTTFSTLCKEASVLLLDGNYYAAATYIGLSALIGIGAAYSGYVLAGYIYGRKKRIKSKSAHQRSFEGEED